MVNESNFKISSAIKKFSFFDTAGRFVCNLYNTDLALIQWEMHPNIVPNTRYVVVTFIDEYDEIGGVSTLQLQRDETPERIVSDGYELREHQFELCVHGFISEPMVINGTYGSLLEVVKRFSEMGCTVYCARTGNTIMYEAGTSRIVAHIFYIVEGRK